MAGFSIPRRLIPEVDARARDRKIATAEHRPHVLTVVQNLSVPLDRRVWMECQALVAAGYRVSVICPRGEQETTFEELEGVRIHRYAPPPSANGLLSYGWEFVHCWTRTAMLAWRIFRRDRFDVIQACNPPDTYFALARLFRPFGVRFVFDHHDLCPELYESRDLTRQAPRPVLAALRHLERATYRSADHVITTNETYLKRARQRTGKPSAAFTVVRSSPDPETMRPQSPVSGLRHGRRHLCCYLGIMGHQDGVENVVHAARTIVRKMGRRDVHFALLGFGDTLERLRSLAAEFGLEDVVTFTGRVGPQEISSYLSTASVGLCPDPKTPFNDASTMNKVLEYMAHALPVTAFDLTETQTVAGRAAKYVPWSGDQEADAVAFAEAVVELLDNPEQASAMGRYGRTRIESDLGWPIQAARYVGAYDQLLGRDSAASANEAELLPWGKAPNAAHATALACRRNGSVKAVGGNSSPVP
jgi:glycosyltransferase involved in cell wall biosynthesis